MTVPFTLAWVGFKKGPEKNMEQKLGTHAIVIGGSIAGLLTGRVLAEHFDQVTILERDILANDGSPRKGAPQGLHNHVMLKAGELVISKWFPHFYERLNASSEVPVIDSQDIHWYHYGFWRLRLKSNLSKTLMTRSYFEWKLRCRIQEYSNISILQECEVTGYLANETKSQVTGVLVKYKQSPERQDSLLADLVVDASGRGSQTPARLSELGYEKPEEQRVQTNMGYATRFYKPADDTAFHYKFLMIYPKAPYGTKIGFFNVVEDNLWILSLVGYLKDYPPDTDAEYLEFARQLEQPDIYEAIKDATPVSSIRTYRFPGSTRRRYERLKRFPGGLLVLGDAVCSFNPVYGQGMSVAAMSVDILDACLRRYAEKRQENAAGAIDISKPYFAQVAHLLNLAWMGAITEDFRFPQTVGKRPRGVKLLNWYMGHLFELVAFDPKICARIVIVNNLLAPASTLFTPYILCQVLKNEWKHHFASYKEPSGPAEATAPQEHQERHAPDTVTKPVS
jgi:2-polyprenyl-6-methoxyphenol hydroxylase-like FAD-dependent oxidoreductase